VVATTKAKYRNTIATDATASNLAEKTEGFSIVGTSRAYSNGRSRMNECNYDESELMGRIYA